MSTKLGVTENFVSSLYLLIQSSTLKKCIEHGFGHFITRSERIKTMTIGGLDRRHVGGQNKRKFVHKVCIKMAGNSQRRKMSLFLSTNMAAMTSHANHQKD